jgi:signal transduction histidine kinase
MRRCIFLLLILVTCFHFLAGAQPDSKKDSLLKLLPAAKDDSTRIMLLIKISALYATKNFDSAFLYMNKAKDFAKEKSITACDPYINTAFAEYYYYNNDYKNASAYALKNLDIAEKKNDDKLRAKTYNNLAAVYNHFGNYRQAIDYALKCLELSEKTKDSASFPIRNLTASNTYYNLKQYEKTILYSKRAVEYGEKFNNTYAVMMGLNNMATAYTDLHKIDSGIFFYTKQLDIAQREEDVVNTIYALINLSYNHFKIGNLPGVEKYLSMLDKVDEQMPDKKTVAEIYAAKSLGYILRKEYQPARAQLDSGIAIAIKENATDALGNLYNTYSKLYFTQNKIKEAEDYTYKYDSLQSALNLKELNFYTEDLETKYETQKKESQIQLQKAELHQKNTLNYILAGSAVALLLISLLSYRNYKNRQKLQQARIDELETEKQLTATEAVLKGEEQERTRLAKDLHDGLGGMLSGIKFSLSNMKGNLIMTPDNAQAFERSIDMLDSSIREMRRVAHNMMPEVLVKYGLDTALKEFCNEIDRSGVIRTSYHSMAMSKADIEQTAAVTIYRIVQELVNNAIKHAAATNVLVQTQYSASEKLLSVTVEDDGKGFDKELLKKASGIGWSNIQNRVDFLKGKIDVQSGEGKGTSVLIEIGI